MSSHQAVALPDSLGQVDWHHPARAVITIDPTTGLRTADSPTRRKKVAIVGFATSTMALAPFHDPEYEIWGMNQLYRRIPRADRWFEIHSNYHEFVVEGTDHLGWLKTCPIPVYMVEAFPEFPTAVRFPLELFLTPKFAKKKAIDYFTSSIAYMIALAYAENFETVAFFGIDLAVGTEYQHQRPCAEFWLGRLFERDVEVILPEECAMLKQTYRYGYIPPDTEPKVKLEEYDTRINGWRQEKEALLKRLYMVDGALQELEWLRQVMDLRMKGACPTVFQSPTGPATVNSRSLEEKVKDYDQLQVKVMELERENMFMKQRAQQLALDRVQNQPTDATANEFAAVKGKP